MGSLGGVQLITKHRLYSPAAFGGHSAMTSHCIRTLFMVKCSTILPRHKFVYYKYLPIFITHGLVSPEHLALYVRSMLPSGMAPCRKVLTEEMPAYLLLRQSRHEAILIPGTLVHGWLGLTNPLSITQPSAARKITRHIRCHSIVRRIKKLRQPVRPLPRALNMNTYG